MHTCEWHVGPCRQTLKQWRTAWPSPGAIGLHSYAAGHRSCGFSKMQSWRMRGSATRGATRISPGIATCPVVLTGRPKESGRQAPSCSENRRLQGRATGSPAPGTRPRSFPRGRDRLTSPPVDKGRPEEGATGEPEAGRLRSGPGAASEEGGAGAAPKGLRPAQAGPRSPRKPLPLGPAAHRPSGQVLTGGLYRVHPASYILKSGLSRAWLSA